MKVVHVITGLHVGGAEMMLHKLLVTMDRSRFDPAVVSLIGGGECRAAIEAEGIEVFDLGMKSTWPSPGQIMALRRLARKLEPDLVQGWMYHGNLAAAMFRKTAPGNPALIWNIRHSVADLGQEKSSTRLMIRLGALTSRSPARIIYNSSISQQQHSGLGYAPGKGLMIPNGFDVDRFCPSPEARAHLRTELGLASDSLLVGVAARRHPMKGHEVFLEAGTRLQASGQNIHFVLVGRGITPADPVLGKLVQGDLAKIVHLLGQRQDMPTFLAGLDLLCVPSLYGEGFPNVLGEAMACGVVCVATDVGESKAIIGDTGLVVPPADPQALSGAIGDLLALKPVDRLERGHRCRDRIRENYSLEKIADAYAELYQSV